jgi:hypothetical protein
VIGAAASGPSTLDFSIGEQKNEHMDLKLKSHHTVWVKRQDWARAVPVRYAVSGNALVTFGDGDLAGLASGDRATASVHEIAGGPAITSFAVSVSEVPPDDIDKEALLELLEHVPLGATLPAVDAAVDQVRHTRRVVALVP